MSSTLDSGGSERLTATPPKYVFSDDLVFIVPGDGDNDVLCHKLLNLGHKESNHLIKSILSYQSHLNYIKNGFIMARGIIL